MVCTLSEYTKCGTELMLSLRAKSGTSSASARMNLSFAFAYSSSFESLLRAWIAVAQSVHLLLVTVVITNDSCGVVWF